MEQLRALEEPIRHLREAGITAARVQQLAAALTRYEATFERIAAAGPKLDRIDEITQLLDELHVLVHRQ